MSSATAATYAAYAAAAVAAASSIYSASETQKANNQQRKAAEDAATAESIRQNNFNREKLAAVGEAVQDAGKDDRADQVEKITEARVDLLKPAAADVQKTGAIATPATPTEVKDDLAGAVANATARANNFQKTLAKLGSYGQSSANNSRSLGRVAGNIGILDNLSAGSLNTMGTEMAMAKFAGQNHLNNASAGQVVGSLANVYSLYGGGTSAPKKS